MIKLIRLSKKIKNDKGEEKNYTNYYIQLENGSYIPIKPAFKNDYKVLYVVATDGDKKESSPF